jgi:hypothetical protein
MRSIIVFLILLISSNAFATSIVEIPHKLNSDELFELGFKRLGVGKSQDNLEWVVFVYPGTLKNNIKPQAVNVVFKQNDKIVLTTSMAIYDFDGSGVKSSSFTFAKDANLDVNIEISYGHDLETSDRIIIGAVENLKTIAFSEFEKLQEKQYNKLINKD